MKFLKIRFSDELEAIRKQHRSNTEATQKQHRSNTEATQKQHELYSK